MYLNKEDLSFKDDSEAEAFEIIDDKEIEKRKAILATITEIVWEELYNSLELDILFDKEDLERGCDTSHMKQVEENNIKSVHEAIWPQFLRDSLDYLEYTFGDGEGTVCFDPDISDSASSAQYKSELEAFYKAAQGTWKIG